MRSSTVSRRVLGLAAAGVLGLSTLAVPGIALADDPVVPGPGVVVPAPVLPPVLGTDAPEPVVSPVVVVAAPTGGRFYVSDGYISITVTGVTSDDFEYSLDNGQNWNYVDGAYDTSDQTTAHGSVQTSAATPNGLVVRNLSGQDRSLGTALTRVVPVGAPTNLTVVPGPSSLTVDWDAPAPNGSTYPVGGYEVYINPVGAEYGGNGCSVDAPVTACTFSVPDAFEYDVTVVALDQVGYSGGDVRLRSAKVPPFTTPTSVPTKDDGDITGPAGAISTLTAGQKVVLQGDRFVAGTTVRLTMFSSPVDLGSVVVASDGTFSTTVTIPANLADGTHTLVATGMGEDGTVRNLVITVTVTGGQATLAVTGFDAVPVAGVGALVVLAGAGLVLGGRRRKA